jgi:hypothetical protein
MSEEEIRRTEVRDRSGKGVSKTPISTKKLGMPTIPAMWEAQVGGSQSRQVQAKT